MILETIPQIGRLSPRQKLALAGELWDEDTAMSELFPVCPGTVGLLEARDADCHRDPSPRTVMG